MNGSKTKRKSLNVNISYLKASDTQAHVPQNSGTSFLNLNTSYSLNWVPSRLTVTTSFNLSRGRSLSSHSLTLGPSLTVAKSSRDKKLRISATANGNQSYSESKLLSQVLTLRWTGSYTVQKKHNLNVSLVALNRSGSGLQAFTEFTGTMGYSYSF